MKQASPNVVPNIFLQVACLGSEWAAEAAWEKRRADLNGFSPCEVWDHPELLLSAQDLETNPSVGAFTMVAARALILKTVKSPAPRRVAITREELGITDPPPVVSSVRDEDPAPIPRLFRSPRPGHQHRSRPRTPAYRPRH